MDTTEHREGVRVNLVEGDHLGGGGAVVLEVVGVVGDDDAVLGGWDIGGRERNRAPVDHCAWVFTALPVLLLVACDKLLQGPLAITYHVRLLEPDDLQHSVVDHQRAVVDAHQVLLDEHVEVLVPARVHLPQLRQRPDIQCDVPASCAVDRLDGERVLVPQRFQKRPELRLRVVHRSPAVGKGVDIHVGWCGDVVQLQDPRGDVLAGGQRRRTGVVHVVPARDGVAVSGGGEGAGTAVEASSGGVVDGGVAGMVEGDEGFKGGWGGRDEEVDEGEEEKDEEDKEDNEEEDAYGGGVLVCHWVMVWSWELCGGVWCWHNCFGVAN